MEKKKGKREIRRIGGIKKKKKASAGGVCNSKRWQESQEGETFVSEIAIFGDATDDLT